MLRGRLPLVVRSAVEQVWGQVPQPVPLVRLQEFLLLGVQLLPLGRRAALVFEGDLYADELASGIAVLGEPVGVPEARASSSGLAAIAVRKAS